MVSLIDKAPSISEAYDTSTPAFREYLEGVISWFENQERDYATIDAEVRASNPPERVMGFRVALKIAESHRILRKLNEPLTSRC